MKYADAIRMAIYDAMKADSRMMILGQGVWSPFYVGQTMNGLEEEFGKDRVIDTPVSENAVTAVALGIAITGSPALVIHPRMDFMILATDPIVNAAAKWRYSLNWEAGIPLTVRSIINRGGEQGAQHSQALHSWFSHIPGLRVVMPSTPRDAYYLLRQSISSEDPVVFIEDRWSYELEDNFETNDEFGSLSDETAKVVFLGDDVTIVGFGHTTNLACQAKILLEKHGKSAEVIDMRVLNPFNPDVIIDSVKKTGRLVVVDGAWPVASMASEVIASVAETQSNIFVSKPIRICLPNSPAPTSKALEDLYYPNVDKIVSSTLDLLMENQN
jgi:pyruvate dehydrogenase E1 component beta subunit